MVNKSKSANKKNVNKLMGNLSSDNKSESNDRQTDQYDYVLSTLGTLKFRDSIKREVDKSKSDSQSKTNKSSGAVPSRNTIRKSPILKTNTVLPDILTDFVRSYEDIKNRNNTDCEQNDTD
ncbi:hypothetical protein YASMINEVIRUS_1290 [Yasminevirus sp. GU-2018]|uniref:Uncharacterized protein n=1 Tax=Yasminevirus sp. GU-2018 TaxID=2420051 RepID=A0A5K0U9R4_9VIRU|nr:hypothetical protein YASMINEVIRUS_1290 [Yasminevirus sp. GU-2018]